MVKDETRSDNEVNVGKHRILVVDDDEALAGTMKEILDISGYEAEIALDGQEGRNGILAWLACRDHAFLHGSQITSPLSLNDFPATPPQLCNPRQLRPYWNIPSGNFIRKRLKLG